ncbi:cytochrome c [Methylobacterium sp. D53M]
MSLTPTARCLAALALIPVAAAAAPEPMRFTSQQVEWPTSDQVFPAGPGAEAISNTCLACHSAGMILTQPALSKAQWSGIVDKMIHSYKASVDPADRQAIIDYLAALKPRP